MLVAITRGVSPEINRCEVSHVPRVPIDAARAIEQHRKYEACLEDLGVKVITLPAEPTLPDSVFVEDPAVVVDELALLTRMGAQSRRREGERLSTMLGRFRKLRWMREPATLEGGDVLRAGKLLFVGLSSRTNEAGVEQLAAVVEPLGYTVRPVEVRGCLHLKSACCALGDKTLLVNREWVDTSAFEEFEMLGVAPEEPGAANVLSVGNTALIPASHPRTAAMIERLGWNVRLLDVSELQKAEAGLTCCSLLFEAGDSR